MNVREQFSKLLEDDKIIIAPGCYDAVSAKIIENLGSDPVADKIFFNMIQLAAENNAKK